MEIVKLLALDGPAHQFHAVEVLPGPQTHVQDPQPAHVLDHPLADEVARPLALMSLWREVAIVELANGPLQTAVGVLVVGGPEGGCQPEGLRVGDGTEVTGLRADDLGLLVLDGADGEVGILGEDFMAVEVVEGGGGILAGYLLKDGLAARMGIDEVGEVVDRAVNHTPEGVVRGVIADLFPRERVVYGSHVNFGRCKSMWVRVLCVRESENEGRVFHHGSRILAVLC